MYCVYAIKSIQRNYIYVGLTNNLMRRLREHNSGHEKTTRSFAPFKVIHVDFVRDRVKARAREKYLKSGAGKEFLKSTYLA